MTTKQGTYVAKAEDVKNTDTKKKIVMDDDRIVGLYWQRSETAITETDAKYGKLCHSVAYGVLKNNEDSEECVNDTYVRAWNSMPPDMPGHLGAYLTKITRRLSIDRFRHNSAAKRSALTVSIFDELSEALPDTAGDSTVDRMVIRDTLNRFLVSLTPENRMIFMRRYWYCDTERSIAKEMHMTELGIKNRLLRMRKKLKDTLEKEGIEG